MAMSPEIILRASVNFIARKLEPEELAEINRSMFLHTDPRKAAGYEKAKGLFTGKATYPDPITHEPQEILVPHSEVRALFNDYVLNFLFPVPYNS